jgi:hypothetical protein
MNKTSTLVQIVSDSPVLLYNSLDVVVFIIFTLGLTLLNWGVRLLVVAPLARILLHGPKKEVLKITRTPGANVDSILSYLGNCTTVVALNEFRSSPSNSDSYVGCGLANCTINQEVGI